MNLQLNDGRVLLKCGAEEEKTSGGIYIPGNVNRDQPVSLGTVVDAGQVKTDSAGKPTSMPFAKGDRVLFSSLGITKVKVNKEEMILVRHEDIIAKVFDTTVDQVYTEIKAVGRIQI